MRFGGKTILKFCLYGLLLLALAGCGSGGGGGGGTDTSPPTAPGSLTTTVISSTQINLQWSASNDDTGVAGYKVYRNGSLLASSVGASSAGLYSSSSEDEEVIIEAVDGITIAEDASFVEETITTTTYTDPTVQGNTLYCYTVSAYDAANNESQHSNQSCATTPSALPSCESGGLPLTISSLVYPSITANWPTVRDGSVAYQGSFNSISTPIMALRFWDNTLLIWRTTVITRPLAYTSNCQIYFKAFVPSDVTGTGTLYFRMIDYHAPITGNTWFNDSESNILSKTVTVY